jgi:hypothetical protein
MVLSTHAVRVSVMPEYAGADLGDERRSKRLVGIVRRLQNKPRASFPEAMQSSAELEGFYRFVNNPGVDPREILEPHRTATLERATRAKTVLAPIFASALADKIGACRGRPLEARGRVFRGGLPLPTRRMSGRRPYTYWRS